MESCGGDKPTTRFHEPAREQDGLSRMASLP